MELARGTGIPHETIRTWFGRANTGKASRPSIEHAIRIANFLGVSLDYLLTGKEFWPELQQPDFRSICLKMKCLTHNDVATVRALVEHLAGAAAQTATPEESKAASGGSLARAAPEAG